MPTLALAQTIGSVDFESPIIEHEERNGGQVGGVEVFGATVVDNERISDVLLFYRFDGQADFADVPMAEIGSSSFYSVRVDTTEMPEGSDSIEYYIRAEDTSGNITLRGFAFQPLNRPFQMAPAVVEPPSEPMTAQTATEPQPTTDTASSPTVAFEDTSTSRVNWYLVALGAVVLGGLAAAATSSGGSSSGTSPVTDECAAGCDFTFTFERP